MINFKISEIDWEKYEYPGFEVGDTLADKVTGQHFRCREVATAKELELGEEDIPLYYKFIAIDNPLGNLGTIWVNPELFNLIQKRNSSGKLPQYKSYAQIREDVGLPPLPPAPPLFQRQRNPLDVLFNGDDEEEGPELTDEEIAELEAAQEAEAEEIANGIDNQRVRDPWNDAFNEPVHDAHGNIIQNAAVAGNAEINVQAPNFAWRDDHVVDLNAPVQQLNVNDIAQNQIQAGEGIRANIEGLGQRIVRAPNPWELDEPNQPVRPERAFPQVPIQHREGIIGRPGEIIFDATGRRFVRDDNGNFMIAPLEQINPDIPRVNPVQLAQDQRIHRQQQADQLRRAANAANPQRRR